MVKVMISLPDDLLQHVDAAAVERGMTRSGLLQDAAGARSGVRRPSRSRSSSSVRASSSRTPRRSSQPTSYGRCATRVDLTLVVGDASVVIKWQHEKGETEVAEARRLVTPVADGALELRILDLTLYEVGNVFVRALRWEAGRAAMALDCISSIVSTLTPSAAKHRLAAELAEEHGLSYYDAAYAAVAATRGGRLVTADRQLLSSGLGVSAVALVAELGLFRAP